MNALRLMRVASCAGAVLFGLLAFESGGASAAGAASKAPAASLSYDGSASAAGVEYSIDSKPPPFPIAGLFDIRSPTGVSALSSSGISQATGAVMTPGNAYSGFGLLCTAQQQLSSFCDGVNSALQSAKLGTFPPNYPLSASSSYPENQGKVQTAQVSGKPVGKGTPITIDPDDATARTTATTADSTASASSSELAGGTPIGVTGGSTDVITHQQLTKKGLVVTGTSTVHNVSIAGLVKIDSVSSVATATNDGHGHITKQGSVTLSGVSAMGHPATIDQHGVSINGGGVLNPAPVLNSALQKALKNSGVTIKIVAGDVHQTKREVKVSSGSLVINFQHNIKNGTLPNPAQYLPCFPPGGCVVGAPDPNAYYFGVTIIGGVDIDNYAAPGISTPPVSNVTSPTTTSGTKGSTKFINGQPGTPGTAGTAGSVGAPDTSPQVAGSPSGGTTGGTVTAGDVLNGTADRLKYIFPALFLAALAAFGGGLLRHPGRIPTPVDR